MFGCVDKLTPKRIQGWARDPDASDRPLVVEVYRGRQRVGRGEAGRYRQDVARQYKSSGRHGFSIPIEGVDDPAALTELRVLVATGGEPVELQNPYQRTLQPSSAHEQAWTEVARYLADGRTRRVLVVGSGSPWLTRELLFNLSLKVDHLDYDVPADLQQMEASDHRNGYDYVLVPDVPGVVAGGLLPFRCAVDHCAPGGGVFLECAVVTPEDYAPEMNFMPLDAGQGEPVLVPTMQGLKDVLLQNYSVRYIHSSSRPARPGRGIGARVSSHLLLCRPRMQTVIVISGATRAGKSTLARTMLASGDQFISLDLLVTYLRALARTGTLPWARLSEALQSSSSLPHVYRVLQAPEVLREFAEAVSENIVASADRVIIEGVGASDEFVIHLRRCLGERAMVSVMSPQQPGGGN